jgi:hypothetical protein
MATGDLTNEFCIGCFEKEFAGADDTIGVAELLFYCSRLAICGLTINDTDELISGD